MGRKKSNSLTDAELSLMHILWRLGSATVADVWRSLPGTRPSYNSIQTRLNILHEKGYAKRASGGRAFRYSAAVERDEVIRSSLRRLLSRLFIPKSALALRLLADEQFTNSELRELQAAIARKRRSK